MIIICTLYIVEVEVMANMQQRVACFQLCSSTLDQVIKYRRPYIGRLLASDYIFVIFI